jgi:hypothetical protein
LNNLWKKLTTLLVTQKLTLAPSALFVFGKNALMYESAQDTITAKAGGTQATATQLTAELNKITTVVSAADAVKLPASAPGLTILIVNKGANPMQVFGTSPDLIDDVATATGVSQMPGSVVLYTCYATGNWYTEGLATGFSGSLQTLSNKTGIIAHAGGTQAAAIADANSQISAMINNIVTCATGGDSVVLPLAVPGLSIFVANAGAASCNVFPFTGDQVNGAGANAAFALANGKSAQFTCTIALNWRAVLSA